jgi:hypothetical protein
LLYRVLRNIGFLLSFSKKYGKKAHLCRQRDD